MYRHFPELTRSKKKSIKVTSSSIKIGRCEMSVNETTNLQCSNKMDISKNKTP